MNFIDLADLFCNKWSVGTPTMEEGNKTVTLFGSQTRIGLRQAFDRLRLTAFCHVE